MKQKLENSVSRPTDSRDNARRTLIKTLFAGGALLSSAKVLPESWIRPITQRVILPAHAETSPASRRFEVTIANMTDGQPFSPPAVIAHGPGYTRPGAGGTTSPGLEVLAEEGSPADYIDEVRSNTDVIQAISHDGLIHPHTSGVASVTIPDGTDIADMRLTVVTMLVNTNDAFTTTTVENLATLGVGASSYNTGITYDAGTEVNDQLMANIPGQGGHTSSSDDRMSDNAGMIIVHQTLQEGEGDIDVAALNWDDPVLRVTVTRTA